MANFEVKLADLQTIARLKDSGTTPAMVANAVRRIGIDEKIRLKAVDFLKEFLELIEGDGLRFCNTDCPRYRQGNCPFESWEDCPKYRPLPEDLGED